MQEGNIWRDFPDERKSLASPPLMSDNRQNRCRRGNEGDLFSDEGSWSWCPPLMAGKRQNRCRRGIFGEFLQMKENLRPFCPPLMSGNRKHGCRRNKEGLFLRWRKQLFPIIHYSTYCVFAKNNKITEKGENRLFPQSSYWKSCLILNDSQYSNKRRQYR